MANLEQDHIPPTPKEKAWAVIRMSLGLAQTMGAVVSLYLLVQTGVNALSIGAAAVTTILTLISLALFRGNKGPNDGC